MSQSYTDELKATFGRLIDGTDLGIGTVSSSSSALTPSTERREGRRRSRPGW
jgi:hypothetical protein